MKNKYYIFIHIKDLYSTAECLKRGFDPETKNLVVAKYERSNETKCLDVSAAMKRLGVKGDSRLFDIPKEIKYVIAEPSMSLYYEYSAAVYEILLRYISKDKICVNTPTEIFVDVTDYITERKETAREISAKLQSVIYDELKIKVDSGIGTNLYFAKTAAMLTQGGITFLDEKLYREKVLNTALLKDFWFVTDEEAELLKAASFQTLSDVLQNGGGENCPVSKRRFKMICECARGDIPVNLVNLKLGKLRITDKSIFPIMRTKAFQNALANAERRVVPKIEFSMEAFETVKEKLKNLEKDKTVNLIYYGGGVYIKLCGVISEIDAKNQSLTVVDKTLSFSDIMEIF